MLDNKKLLEKLDKMYDKEDELKKEMKRINIEWKQLQEDKELLQTLIMHQSNKEDRIKQFKMEDLQ